MKVIFDVETTGLDNLKDEIIQFSAIDENENILLSTYVKPEHVTSWPEAQQINGISPEMVAKAPTFNEIKAQVQNIFDRAEELIAYNGIFDIGFLSAAGIQFDFTRQHLYDVMLEFAPIYGEWNEYYGDYKWQKLTTAANYYGYKFNAHDSLEDVKATLHCYNSITTGVKGPVFIEPHYSLYINNETEPVCIFPTIHKAFQYMRRFDDTVIFTLRNQYGDKIGTSNRTIKEKSIDTCQIEL